MALTLTSLSDAPWTRFDTVIDVRAPAEFAEDHLPGAISLAVLSDEERARVGTIYKQVSAFEARKIGAALVARNAARHIEERLMEHDGAWRPLVYCWRGGQRSNSFASILSQIGWRVEVLDGGYRSYRRLVNAMLHEDPLPHRLVLLDGNTGTAKTAVLARLAATGVQVLDLEGMAEHRGSIFGGLEAPQPAQKMFESRIVERLATLDTARPVLVEAESSKIGRLGLPKSLWQAMCAAPRIEIEAPVAARADYLVRAYADLVEDAALLEDRLEALRPLRGGEQVAQWKAQAQARELPTLAEGLITAHYDPAYARSRARSLERIKATVTANELDESGLDRLAAQVSEALDRLDKGKAL